MDVANNVVAQIYHNLDSCAFPTNRLKLVINCHHVTSCLTNRTSQLLATIETFNNEYSKPEQIAEKFIKSCLMDHLKNFNDGGNFMIRFFHFLLMELGHLPFKQSQLIKCLSLFRKVVLELIEENDVGIEKIDFSSCKPLVDVALSQIGSKRSLCYLSCDHQNCQSLQLSLAIVRLFLQTIDYNPDSTFRLVPMAKVLKNPELIDGILIKIPKEESFDLLTDFIHKKFFEKQAKVCLFVDSPSAFGNPVENEEKGEENLLKNQTVHFGTSFDRFKKQYCSFLAEGILSSMNKMMYSVFSFHRVSTSINFNCFLPKIHRGRVNL